MINGKLITDVFLLAKNQGVSFLLLSLFAWYSFVQMEELRHKVDSCFEGQIENLEKKNQEYIQIIERNTQALERLTFIIQNQNKSK